MEIPSIQVPSSVIYSQEPTTREAFPMRSTFEYLSDSQSAYSFDRSNRITFTINDPTYMLDALESYVKFDLTTDLTEQGGARNAVVQASRSLTTGGAHAIFSAVEIRLSNGTLLDRIEGYNLLYAITSYATHSHDHVNQIERMSGDSVKTFEEEVVGVPTAVVFTVAGSQYVGATNVLTLTAGDLTNVLVDGDELIVNTAGARYRGFVHDVTAATTAVVDLGAVDIAAGAVVSVTRIRRATSFKTRTLAAQTNACSLTMRLMSGFLQQHRLIPLPLLRNLQIILELTRPEIHLMTHLAPSVNRFVATATIENPRFVASLVQPSDSLLKMLSNVRANPLYMQWQGYRHSVHNISGGNGNISVMLNVNYRSCRHVIFAITTSRTESVSLDNAPPNPNRNTLNYDSTGTFVKAGLGSWQVRLGGKAYPDNEVKVDVLGNATLTECMKTIGVHNHSQAEARVTAQQWQSINTVSGVANESEVFFGMIRLDSDGFMTGSSLQNQNIQLELNFTASNAAYGTGAGDLGRILHSWVCGDVICQISDQGVRVFS